MMLNAALIQAHAPLGIALSGGSDSTALLILAVDLLGAQNLRALTVNHGLRAAAAHEAESAKALCASLGVAHETVTLEMRDGADLQARARAARYHALGCWAQDKKLGAIALGHTQDDVAETFLMRLARGSGVDGLAQMAEQFTRHETIFLRPLMDAQRVNLQVFLRARGIAWSDDPSNNDPRFTRVQMRQAQPDLAKLGLSSTRLSQTAKWMRAASQVLEVAADDWIAQHAWVEHGDAVFEFEALKNAPDETACRALTRALCAISGRSYRPRFSTLEDLRQSETAKTLHGCLVYPHKDTLRITQELNAISQSNNRWTINGPLSTEHNIAPLGDTGLRLCKDWRETALLPRRSLRASPGIWLGRDLIAAPLAKPELGWNAKAPDPLHLAK